MNLEYISNYKSRSKNDFCRHYSLPQAAYYALTNTADYAISNAADYAI